MKQARIQLPALFLILGGILYITIQFIHPPDTLESVKNTEWLIVSALSSLIGFLLFVGITGHSLTYWRNMRILGHIGFVLFSLFWLLTIVFSFIEAFVLPLVAETSPEFVEGMMGLFGSEPATVDLGVFPLLVNLAGAMYILGGVLYGISGYRNSLPHKYSYLFLAFAALATIAAGILGHPLDRILAIPMGLALIWLGWNLRQEQPHSLR